MALVRDPAFWRRFSRAIHLDEEAKAQLRSTDTIISDEWIKKERRKKKRHVICCVTLSIAVILVVTAVAVVLWWLGTHNWGRDTKRSEEMLELTTNRP